MCIVNCLFECLCTFLIPMYIVQKFIQKGKEYNGNSEQKFVVMVYFDFSDHFSSSSYSFLFFYELDSILVGIASIALVYQTNLCDSVCVRFFCDPQVEKQDNRNSFYLTKSLYSLCLIE